MAKYLLLILSVCAFARLGETKTSLANSNVMAVAEKRLERDAPNSADNHSHVDVHHDDAVKEQIAIDESFFYVSALFRKYSNPETLTKDGLARLFCSLGLIPTGVNAALDSLADDASNGHETDSHGASVNCDKITFETLQAMFDDYKRRESDHDHDHDEHHHHHHSHNHSDHDHQPNRNVSTSKFSSSQDGHTSDPKDEADHHNHADHAHDHHGDHESHGDTHDDHYHDQNNDNEKSDSHVHASDSNSPDHNATHSDMMISNLLDKTEDTTQNSRKKRETDGNGEPECTHTKCMSPKTMLELFHFPAQSLDAQQFKLLCPALLHQIISGSCQHQLDHEHDHEVHSSEATKTAVPGKVWGFSTAAVLVISLAGLLGVAAIPIMQKVFYNHLLQFLVAVAVGALSGDALLHLLPHAISKNLGHDHSSHDGHDHGSHQDTSEADHLDSVWKGLVALLCIFFFFLIERVLTIVTEKKRRKKQMSRLKKRRCERLCDVEKSGGVGAKLSAHEESDYMDCEQMVMVVHPNRALKGYADATHDVLMHQCDESLSQAEQAFDDDKDSSHSALGHSHGHGHGHAHCDTVPGSVAAVAWMVIFGDGIHNFSDGLAIGAAFASSVTGGISTSIAIFCHELPHEIGDFAVLLRAGMSVKQAIVYNCVSSGLCFMGMLIGVAIGNIHSASIWIFSGVGGMFLYISMVVMLPEMTAVDTKKGENQYLHLLLQVVGMMIGACIMLTIAIYEHDLQRILD